MNQLINSSGQIEYGIYDFPIDQVNYQDYAFETPMGTSIPKYLKKFLINQFLFVGVSGPDIFMGIAIVDLKYLKNGFFYVFDRNTGQLYESSKLLPPWAGVRINPTPCLPDGQVASKALQINIDNHHVTAKAKGLSVDLDLNLEQTRPLRICTRAGYRGWVYTQKTSPINVTGTITYPEKRIDLTGQYSALMDWTCGWMRHDTYWNWAAICSKISDTRTLGLNLSCGVNETSFTENAFWINQDMTKVDMVSFEYNPKDLYQTWHITSRDKRVDLLFVPNGHRKEQTNALVIASRFTQLFGEFSGNLKPEKGRKITLEQCPGWVEDHYAKW